MKIAYMTPVAAIAAERLDWVYLGNHEDDIRRGCIGHLRGDFGRDGDEFWTTFFDHLPELKSDAFRDEFQAVVTALRKRGGLLHDFKAMLKKCCDGRPCGRDDYAFETQTPDYLYCIRAIPRRGDYNFYVYAYDKRAMRDSSGEAQKSATWEEWWPGDASLIMTGEEMLWMCSSCNAKYPEKHKICPYCKALMQNA